MDSIDNHEIATDKISTKTVGEPLLESTCVETLPIFHDHDDSIATVFSTLHPDDSIATVTPTTYEDHDYSDDDNNDNDESTSTSGNVLPDASLILCNDSYNEVKESEDIHFYERAFEQSAVDHTVERQTVEAILTQQMIEILVGIRPKKEFRVHKAHVTLRLAESKADEVAKRGSFSHYFCIKGDETLQSLGIMHHTRVKAPAAAEEDFPCLSFLHADNGDEGKYLMLTIYCSTTNHKN